MAYNLNWRYHSDQLVSLLGLKNLLDRACTASAQRQGSQDLCSETMKFCVLSSNFCSPRDFFRETIAEIFDIGNELASPTMARASHSYIFPGITKIMYILKGQRCHRYSPRR
jgi:hypothetical protein